MRYSIGHMVRGIISSNVRNMILYMIRPSNSDIIWIIWWGTQKSHNWTVVWWHWHVLKQECCEDYYMGRNNSMGIRIGLI